LRDCGVRNREPANSSLVFSAIAALRALQWSGAVSWLTIRAVIWRFTAVLAVLKCCGADRHDAMHDKHWFLKRCDLFGKLDAQQLAHLETCCRIGEFPRGKLIYLPSDASDGCFLLAAGRVRIFTVTPDGKQSIVAFIEPGDLFGELAIFDSARRDEFAEAAEKSTVVLVPGEVVRSLALDNAALSFGIVKLIGLRRRRIERRLRGLLFRSTRHRLIHLLLELAEQYGYPTARGVQIGLKLSHQELASVIGSARESVTLLLGQLQQEGSLAIARRRIELVNPQRLAVEIEFSPLAQPPVHAPGPKVDSKLQRQRAISPTGSQL
jgi:CRP-like cAMP-binding protein